MSAVSFSKELVDHVVRYLMSRPYSEVFNLLDRMNQEAAPQLVPQPLKAVEEKNEPVQEVKSV